MTNKTKKAAAFERSPFGHTKVRNVSAEPVEVTVYDSRDQARARQGGQTTRFEAGETLQLPNRYAFGLWFAIKPSQRDIADADTGLQDRPESSPLEFEHAVIRSRKGSISFSPEFSGWKVTGNQSRDVEGSPAYRVEVPEDGVSLPKFIVDDGVGSRGMVLEMAEE